MLRSPTYLPWLVLACGMAYTLYLQSSVGECPFFSSDAGYKWMQTERFARGDFHADVTPPAPEWARRLWSEGFHPFTETTFEIEGKRYSSFPYTFPLVSAPFYALFGNRGLFLLPLVGLWALWLMLLRSARAMRGGDWITSGVLLAIMTSGLTPYAAMYWEHTVAIALAFAGMSWIMRLPEEVPEPRALTFYGTCAGAAGWLRPECFPYLALFLVALVIYFRKTLGRSRIVAYALPGCTLVVAFFVANYIVYGNAFGTHSFLVLHGPRTALDRVRDAADTLNYLSREFVLYIPAVLWVAAALGVLACTGFTRRRTRHLVAAGMAAALVIANLTLSGKGGYKMAATELALIPLALVARPMLPIGDGVFVALLVSFIAAIIVHPMTPDSGGYQVGPRYLYHVVPVIALAVAPLWLALRGRVVRAGLLLLFFGVIGRGIYINIEVHDEMKENYAGRVVPALDYLRTDGAPIVGIARSWLAQDLAQTVGEKQFFFVKDEAAFDRLLQALAEQDFHEMLFIVEGTPGGEDPSFLASMPAKPGVKVTRIGRRGHHCYFYKITFAG